MFTREPRDVEDDFSANCRHMIHATTMGLLVVFAAVVVACQVDFQMKHFELAELDREIREIKKLLKTRNNVDERKVEAADDEIGDDGEHKICTEELRMRIRVLLREELSVLAVDGTGTTDFAMRALGGSIVSTPNTTTFGASSITSHLTILGIKIGQRANDASTILEPNNLPGDCWAFHGKRGTAVIRLFAKIVVTNISLEHIPRGMSPSGDIRSAPRVFSLVGLESPNSVETGHNFGTFLYNDNGPPIQTYPIRFTFVQPVQHVRVDFQDNHGHGDFTCVYRFRVHGIRSEKPIRDLRLPG